jgi:signal transduction histidine kinase
MPSNIRTPASPRKRAGAYVSLAGQVRDGGYEITVENYGVGIDPDEYELIFQRGYQGRQTRREYRSGQAGLALTRPSHNSSWHAESGQRVECGRYRHCQPCN